MDNDTGRRLESIEKKLDGLVQVMEKVAVQKTRIDNIEKDVITLWKKWDNNISPHMQDCPKIQVRWLWCIVVPQGLTLFVVALSLLSKIL